MNLLPLQFYATASFINFVTSFIFGLLLIKHNSIRSRRLLAYICFAVAGWSWFYTKWINANSQIIADYYLRTCMMGVLLIPPCTLEFITRLINKPLKQYVYTASYTLSIIFILTAYTPLYAYKSEPFLIFPYWLHPGPIFHVAIAYFAFVGLYSIRLMHQTLRTSKGMFRNQILYAYLATLIGYFGGSTNYFCWYRIPIPPFLNACVAFYVAFLGYAIIRYKLWDIHFVIRRTIANIILSLFISIGILIILFASLPIIIKIFSTIALSLVIALYLPKLKDSTDTIINTILYKTKYHYQDKLDRFIELLVFIPDEQEMLDDTIDTLISTLSVKQGAVFIYNPTNNAYCLKVQRGMDTIPTDIIPLDSNIIQWLKQHQIAFLLEEQERYLSKKALSHITSVLKPLKAAVCIPILLKKDLNGVIVLSEKISGEMYSHIDIRLLQRLGKQLALGINYRRLEAKMRKSQELRAIDSMAAEICHEFTNIIQQPKTFIDMLDQNRKDDPVFMGEFKTMAVNRMNVLKGKLLDIMYYSSPSKLNLNSVNVHSIIDAVIQSKQKNIDNASISMTKTYGSIPDIRIDKLQAEQIFKNALSNAIDAIIETKQPGSITITTKPYIHTNQEMIDKSDQWIRIEITDTGCGLPDKIKRNMFTPFTTTKSAGVGHIQRTGSGLGLCLMKKAVDAHRGYIYLESLQKKGTTVIIDLPVNLKYEPVVEGLDKEPWE